VKLRYKRPDKKNALSIVQASKRDMVFTLKIKPTEESGPTIIRNIYGCFRMLGDALLILEGIESADHVKPINELMKLKVATNRPINLVDNMRRLRHNINYYGYKPSLFEVEDSLSMAKDIFEPLHKEVLKKL